MSESLCYPQSSAMLTRKGLPSVLAVCLFVLITGFFFQRNLSKLVVPKGDNAGRWAYAAYRDATYYPVVALLEGKNPYDAELYMKTYPVGDVLPPYLPITLVLHLPLGLVDFQTSVVLYFLLTLLLTVILSAMMLRIADIPLTVPWVFGLSTALLLTRPGQNNLLLGECTVPMAIGVYLLVSSRWRKSNLAILGFIMMVIKPTYGLPLGVLLLARRDYRTVLSGGIITAVLAFSVTGVLAHHAGGVGPLVSSLVESYHASEDHPDSDPATSPSRIDAKGVIGRILQTDPGVAVEFGLLMVLLGLGCLALRKLDTLPETPGKDSLILGVVCLVTLTSIFHQPYDLLLLAGPWLLLAVRGNQPPWNDCPRLRWFTLGLMTIPLVNYVGSATAFEYLGIEIGTPLWIALSSVNGVVLLVVLGVYLKLAFRGLVPSRDSTDPHTP